MTVTVRLDAELRKKDYWSKVPDGQTFEYLRDRAGGIAILKDKRGNLISCVKEKVVFPEAITVEPEVLDKLPNQEDTSTKET